MEVIPALEQLIMHGIEIYTRHHYPTDERYRAQYGNTPTSAPPTNYLLSAYPYDISRVRLYEGYRDIPHSLAHIQNDLDARRKPAKLKLVDTQHFLAFLKGPNTRSVSGCQ